MPRVLVTIVTYNSGAHLGACLESLRDQSHPDLRVCIWDNASHDDTAQIAAEYGDLLYTVRFQNSNTGFCAGHNRLIAGERSDYVLVLNPDVVLEPWYVEHLVRAMERDPYAGSATGKLWRMGSDKPIETPSGEGAGDALDAEPVQIIDTTGIFMTPNQRHFDRGAGEPDLGQFERREYVFGASGAAALYRRAMLETVKAGGEYFDESFFAYREDADLAWRAQWLGWRCIYVPEARGRHVRAVVPERRRSLPPEINMHSFKNRFLMRIKNMDAGTYLRFFFPITARDLGAVAYVLLHEHSSLPAFPLLARALPKAWSLRRALRRHRREKPSQVRRWFAWRPVTEPVLF